MIRLAGFPVVFRSRVSFACCSISMLLLFLCCCASNSYAVQLFAGTGTRGAHLDADPKQTQLNSPQGVVELGDGRVLITDMWNHRVVVVSENGSKIERYAGTDTPGAHLHADPKQTQLSNPRGVVELGDGRVLI